MDSYARIAYELEIKPGKVTAKISMDIVLLNPRIKTWSPNVYVPLGLAYIAAALEQKNYSVNIVDLNVQRMGDSSLQGKVINADVVGITGMITEYEEILRLINIVKKGNSEAKVVLGGPLATTLPRELLQASQVDFIVLGEGEKTIVKLLQAIEQGHSPAGVRGIAYREGGQVVVAETAEPIADLDTIPFPARHLFDVKRYLKNHMTTSGSEPLLRDPYTRYKP